MRVFEGMEGVVRLVTGGFAVAANFISQVRGLGHLFLEALLARQIQGNQYRATDGHNSDDDRHGYDQTFVQAAPDRPATAPLPAKNINALAGRSESFEWKSDSIEFKQSVISTSSK